MFVLISNFKLSFDPIYFDDDISFDAINFGLFYRPRMQTAQVQRYMTRNDCLTIAIAITFLASIHFRSCCAQNPKKIYIEFHFVSITRRWKTIFL